MPTPTHSLASRRHQLSAWSIEAKRIDVAVYEAILRTQTPNLDRHMSRLTQPADTSRLWLGLSALIAPARGPGGGGAPATGLASVAVPSAVANLALKPLG